jgi:hypothetical protein
VEETPEAKRSDYGVMRATAKNKVQSFKGQFSKYTAIANPKLGDEFLEEVCQIYLCDHFILSNSPFIDYLYRCKSFVGVRDHVMVAIGLNNYLFQHHRLPSIVATTTRQRWLWRSCNTLQRLWRHPPSKLSGWSGRTPTSTPVRPCTS